MAKIVNLDGSAAGTEKLIEELTNDKRLRKLGNCATAGDLKKLWLGREVDREDVQVALLMQLVGDIQHLGNAIAVLLAKLETLTTQSNTRIN
jgi:hypothetical protein